MRIFFIRHGKTTDYVNGMRQSNSSELHEASIKLLKDKKDYEQITFNTVYSSHYIRAIQTAELLFPKYKIEVLDFIHEFIPPTCLDGLTRKESDEFWLTHLTNIYKPEWSYDGSESFNDIVIRAGKCIDYLLNNHENADVVAVVTHGILMKHILGMLIAKQNYSPIIFADFLFHLHLQNGSYIDLEIDKVTKKVKFRSLHNE